MRILLICSANPTIGPARLSLDMKAAFEKVGHDVVLLTKFPVKDRPDIDFVLKTDKFSLIDKVKYHIFKLRQRDGYYFFYKKETDPPVKTATVLDSIHGDFDLVYVLFWQGLISFETIDKLYDRYPVPFIFSAVDYSVMTGGCHFMHDCDKYQTNCGSCPGIRSVLKNDFTRFNIEYRKKVYSKINPVILTNTYNQAFFRKSVLTKDSHYVNVLAIINEESFKPRDKQALRNKYGIPEEKRNILFFGSQNLSDKRKGMGLLIESLSALYDMMSADQRDATLVISAGRSDGSITGQIKFETMDKGFVNFDALAELYSLADVYLSPSIVDAGPMMVGQAIMCGTPVVAFNIGLALDMVEGKGTGYCAALGNTLDFSRGIYQYLFVEDREAVSRRCREVGLENCSYDVFVKLIDIAYNTALERMR